MILKRGARVRLPAWKNLGKPAEPFPPARSMHFRGFSAVHAAGVAYIVVKNTPLPAPALPGGHVPGSAGALGSVAAHPFSGTALRALGRRATAPPLVPALNTLMMLHRTPPGRGENAKAVWVSYPHWLASLFWVSRHTWLATSSWVS